MPNRKALKLFLKLLKKRKPMDIYHYLYFVWIPSLAIAIFFLARAVYFTQYLRGKYQLAFPPNIFGIARTSDLKIAHGFTQSEEIKGKIEKILTAKGAFYIFVTVAAFSYLLPVILFDWLLKS